MNKQQFFPVNWTDGMKLNKSHFISQENAINYNLAQISSGLLTDYSYGLLAPDGYENHRTNIYVSTDNQQQVTVRVLECRALTRGGYYIQISNNDSTVQDKFSAHIPQLSVPFNELKGRADSYYVILTVNPYNRISHGLPDPEEHPARLPSSMPSYELSLIPIGEESRHLLGLYHLPIGKIRVDEQRVSAEAEYIPPCCSLQSYKDLVDIHAQIEQFYGRMETYSLQIIQKINQKKQQNEMSAIVNRLCEVVLNTVSVQLVEISTLSLHQPPVLLVNKLTSLARILKNTLDCYIGSGKEELINYCTEWCNINQGELELSMINLSNHPYKHLDMNESVDRMIQFTRIISNLFSNLAKLDYIGKKKDAGIFVKEQVINNDTPAAVNRRKSFLAE